MPEEGYRMDEDFRGVLEDVVDGQTWAGYAGPGATVRGRGERRRRRAAGTSVAGVAMVAAAVTAVAVGFGAGTGTAKQGPAAVSGSGTTSPTAAHGRYVNLNQALLHPEDLGPGFTAAHVSGLEPVFHTGMCAHDASRTTAGTPVLQEYDGDDSAGVRLMTSEGLYQFLDSGSARTAFETARTTFHAGCGQTSSPYQTQDVAGVGDGMFVVRQAANGANSRWDAYVLVGGVVIDYSVMSGSSNGVTALPDGWLTGVAQKAVTRVHGAPMIDAPATGTVAIGAPHPGTPSQPQTQTQLQTQTPQPLPVSQPVDGVLFAPADLGPSFTADKGDEWTTKEIPTATSAIGMVFRGTISGGDGEFLVNEGVYRFSDAAAAQSGLASYSQSTTQTPDPVVPLPGIGDQAWIKHWQQRGGVTVVIRSGSQVITFDVLAGGTSADQPIPGGDAWVHQIARTALQRLAVVK